MGSVLEAMRATECFWTGEQYSKDCVFEKCVWESILWDRLEYEGTRVVRGNITLPFFHGARDLTVGQD